MESELIMPIFQWMREAGIQLSLLGYTSIISTMNMINLRRLSLTEEGLRYITPMDLLRGDIDAK